MTALGRFPGAVIAASLLLAACGLGNYAAYIAMIALLIGMVNPGAWSNLNWAVRHPSVQMFVLAWVLLAVAILIQAQRGVSDPAYIFDFLPLLLALPAALAFRQLSDPVWLKRFFLFALLGSFVALGVVIYQGMVLGASRPAGIENSPIHFAILALIVGFVAAGGFLQSPSWSRAFYLLGPLFGLAASLLTGSRAALPSLALIILAAGVVMIICRKISFLQALLGGLCLAAGLAGVASLALVLDTGASRAVLSYQNIWDAISGDYAADSSFASRLEQYWAFLPAFSSEPIFGHGWQRQMEIAVPFMSQIAQEQYLRQTWGYIHNEFLSMTLGMGVLGSAAYLLIFAAPIAGLWRLKKDPDALVRAYAVIVVLSGIFAGGLADVLFMNELPKTFLVFVCCAFLVAGTRSHQFGDTKSDA